MPAPSAKTPERDALAVLDRSYRRAIGGDDVVPVGICRGASGAVVWRVAAASRSWALRRWPDVAVGQRRIPKAADLLRGVRRAGVRFTPEPIPCDGGADFVVLRGGCWELQTWMPGEPSRPSGATPAAVLRGSVHAFGPEGESRRRFAAAIIALRQFHRAARGLGPTATDRSPALIDRRQRLRRALATDWRIAGEAAVGADCHRMKPLILRIAHWLPAAAAIALRAVEPVADQRVRLQPVIRDARREHFLFTGARVTGLVDFGAASVDTPAVDLTRLLGDWAGDDAAAWEAGLGVAALPPNAASLVPALDASGVVLASANWLGWIAAGAPASRRRLECLANRLASLGERGGPICVA